MTDADFNNRLLELESNLKRFALSLTSDMSAANDLLQETYLKALLHKDQFAESSNLKAWAFTIMKNTFVNIYRKNSRLTNSIDGPKELNPLNLRKDAFHFGPETEMAENEIIEAIEALDDDLKIPFRMHTEGYKYKEIAEQLDLKIGTVKSRIFFTRKKLMSSLESYKR